MIIAAHLVLIFKIGVTPDSERVSSEPKIAPERPFTPAAAQVFPAKSLTLPVSILDAFLPHTTSR